MMKNYKYMHSVFLLIVVVGIWLSGCSKTVYGISSGTYTMRGAQDEIIQPSITFDVEEKTFSFFYDVFSSYSPVGTWDFNDEKAVAKTDDGKYTYIFEVVNNNTIRFVQKDSSQITRTDGTAPIIDGTKFKFKD